MKYPQASPTRRLSRMLPTSRPRMPVAAIWIQTSENTFVASQSDAASTQRGDHGELGNTRNGAMVNIARAARRLVFALTLCLFACTPVVTAQTIQCQSVVLTNSSPCETGRCLLTRWVATVPPSQTLTYAVELSTDCLTWQESTAPITLTESATVNVWVTADNRVGFIRLRIVQ
jgi:hypothetical protein